MLRRSGGSGGEEELTMIGAVAGVEVVEGIRLASCWTIDGSA